MEISVQELGWGFVRTCFKLYQNSGIFVYLFLIAMFFLFLRKKAGWERPLGYFIILLFLTVFNPLISAKVVEKLNMSFEFYRFIWILPISVVIAYSLTFVLFDKERKAWIRYGFLCACLLLILFPGKTILAKGLEQAENLYKIPKEVIQVCDIIKNDFDEQKKAGLYLPDERIRVAAEFEWIVLLNQYDPSIELTLTYGRVSSLRAIEDRDISELPVDLQVRRQIMHGMLDYEELGGTVFSDAINVSRTHYIIIRTDSQARPFVEGCSVLKISEISDYIVYRVIPY
ncbi:MAG: YfhO family protein [Lachnospiraceae bacterium]|jgi:hypothetical protein|nr:YfhO family protein [Lachnospiraceae bacterium]